MLTLKSKKFTFSFDFNYVTFSLVACTYIYKSAEEIMTKQIDYTNVLNHVSYTSTIFLTFTPTAFYKVYRRVHKQ